MRGRKRMEVADAESVKRLTKWLRDTYEEPYFSIGNLGTSCVIIMLSEQGVRQPSISGKVPLLKPRPSVARPWQRPFWSSGGHVMDVSFGVNGRFK